MTPIPPDRRALIENPSAPPRTVRFINGLINGFISNPRR